MLSIQWAGQDVKKTDSTADCWNTRVPIISSLGYIEGEGVIVLEIQNVDKPTDGIPFSEFDEFSELELLDHDDGQSNDAAASKSVLSPRLIFSRLSVRVIGQADAKMTLALAGYQHLLRVTSSSADTSLLRPANVLLIGESGSGKTLLVESLAEILGVPFLSIDANSLTEAGYVGADASDIFEKLYMAANANLARAQSGVVFIDEIDKIAKNLGDMNAGVSREGAQDALLKILEGGRWDFLDPYDRGRKLCFDAKKLLFICAGAFDEITSPTPRRENLGFKSRVDGRDLTPADSDKRFGAYDLINYGMKREFIARFPQIVQLDALCHDDMVKILRNVKDSELGRCHAYFRSHGVELHVGDDALEAIAHEAVQRGLGARGLTTVVLEVLRDAMFELPDHFDVRRCEMNVESVTQRSPLKFHQRARTALSRGADQLLKVL